MNRFHYWVYIVAISVANWAEARQWGIVKRKLRNGTRADHDWLV